MHIILVSNRLATTRTLNITPRLITTVALGLFVFCLSVSFLLARFGGRFVVAPTLVASAAPAPQDASQALREKKKSDEYVRSNITSMAVKLGEVQAQVMRLDALSERVSKLSGVELPKIESKDGGSGGPLILSLQAPPAVTLQREIDHLAEIVDQRNDALTILASQLVDQRAKLALLPTGLPMRADYRVGSSFGWRTDPFAGVSAKHEGVDFVADQGTPVLASAGGVVTTAEFHPQYGNMVEISHGNDFSSLYAHLSKLDVKPGQLVKRGQALGLSGNTGRSTGPHLHFEVRFKGDAQDPTPFLRQGPQLALNSVSAPAKTAPKALSKAAPSTTTPRRSRISLSFY